MQGETLAVRKGAWTHEEDALLTQCINKYGEGQWHKVPLRAGLKRCRKSCRLRWVNYLSPNIKRGAFSEDEIDLMIRLHKLLGNRWSLIAGRIPGRTANDVKNYWKTHHEKKLVPPQPPKKSKDSTTETVLIKPRPQIFMSSPIDKTIKPPGEPTHVVENDHRHVPHVSSNIGADEGGTSEWWNFDWALDCLLPGSSSGDTTVTVVEQEQLLAREETRAGPWVDKDILDCLNLD